MNEVVVTNPTPTAAALADALTALSAEAARRSLSHGGPLGSFVDAETASETAEDWRTTPTLVQLACDYSTRGRAALEEVAALGLADKHDDLIQLGYECVARYPRERILAAALPAEFELLETEDGVSVQFPRGKIMPWADAVRQRELSIEPAPVVDAEG